MRLTHRAVHFAFAASLMAALPTASTASPAMVPLCIEVAASLSLGPDGLPPLPTTRPPVPLSPQVLQDRMRGVPFVGGGYNVWIRRATVSVVAENVAAARAALALSDDGQTCVDEVAVPPTAEVQPTGGPGWRLLAAGPFRTRTIIGVGSSGKVSQTKAWADFGVPRIRQQAVQTNEIIVAYSLHRSGSCEADRVIGINVDTRLHTFQLERAKPPISKACTANRQPWGVVIAVNRSVLPSGKVVFRDCRSPMNCSTNYLVVDLDRPFSYLSVREAGPAIVDVSKQTGSCASTVPAVQVPSARHCDVVGRFDSTRVVATTRYDEGQVVFYLLSPDRSPEELPGTVMAVGSRHVAMLDGPVLKVRSGEMTDITLAFLDGLPRANSSGREGAFNADGSRLAVFLQAPGASRDSDSVAIGIVDVKGKTMRTVPTREFTFPVWTSPSVLRVGNVVIDARTGEISPAV
jgi:hypothetical protein